MMNHHIRNLTLGALLALAATAPALAQVSININLAPPQPQYEAVPALPPGQVWAPGYWAWNGDRHIWVRGRTIASREGYRWAPDRWEQRGDGYYRNPGYWVRDTQYVVVKEKKDKKFKHKDWDKGKHHGKGKGHGKHD